jgi:glutaminase
MMATLQELVGVFNFHRYDNLKHASNKKDPRRHKYETMGLSIVNLLFSAASGDVTAMRRSAGTSSTLEHSMGQP